MTDLTEPFSIRYNHNLNIVRPPPPAGVIETLFRYAWLGYFVAIMGVFYVTDKFYSSYWLICVVWLVVMGAWAIVRNFTGDGPPVLYVGPRYMVCGKSVIYYQSLDSVMCDGNSMQLMSGDKVVFVIHKSKMYVESRKTAKINTKQTSKFQQLKTELLSRVQANNPGVKIIGN